MIIPRTTLSALRIFSSGMFTKGSCHGINKSHTVCEKKLPLTLTVSYQ